MTEVKWLSESPCSPVMSLIRHLSQIPTINGTFYHFNVRKPQNVLLQNAHCMGSLANRYQSILAGLSEPCQDSLCGMPEPHQNSWGLTSSSGVSGGMSQHHQNAHDLSDPHQNHLRCIRASSESHGILSPIWGFTLTAALYCFYKN